jgi:hypothetical protein
LVKLGLHGATRRCIDRESATGDFPVQSIETCGTGRDTKKRHRQPCDDELMDEAATCRFFGNIHPATLWRGIKVGRYSKPIKVAPNINRWIRTECAEDMKAIIAERDSQEHA